MQKNRAVRLTAFIGSAALTAGLAGLAVAGTGAYFTDAEAGTISATMGTIKIDTSGGDDGVVGKIAFTNMLPGETQAKTINFGNTGSRAQDVWLVFTSDLGDQANADQTLINNWGRYAEIHITSGSTPVFESNNLNDNPSCPLGEGDPDGSYVCNPLPQQVKLASNLNPGAWGSMTFAFRPSSRFDNAVQAATILSLDYKIVATQPGIAPDAVATDGTRS